MKHATIFALAAGIADLPNEDARLAAARIVAHVAQTERESFDVENFATAAGIARHLAPGLLALPVGTPEPPAERPPSPWFRIFYKCPECAEEWEEEWSSACDSECPKCGTENIECDRYEDMNEEAEPLAVLPAAPYRYEAGKIIGPPMNAWGAGYVPATIVCQVTAGDAGTGGQYSHYPAEVATRHIEIMLAALNAQPLGTLPA